MCKFNQGVIVFQSRKKVKLTLNFERSYPSSRARVKKSLTQNVAGKNIAENTAEMPFFFHSAKTVNVCGASINSRDSINSGDSTNCGAFFRNFLVSKLITPTQAHRIGVLIIFFCKSFQSKKKLRSFFLFAMVFSIPAGETTTFWLASQKRVSDGFQKEVSARKIRTLKDHWVPWWKWLVQRCQSKRFLVRSWQSPTFTPSAHVRINEGSLCRFGQRNYLITFTFFRFCIDKKRK